MVIVNAGALSCRSYGQLKVWKISCAVVIMRYVVLIKIYPDDNWNGDDWNSYTLYNENDEIYDNKDVHCCAQKSNCHSSELFSKGIAKVAQK